MRRPDPPYYAVIFGSQRTQADAPGYAATAERMVELAAQQPGYLGAISTRGPDGFGITVSYWASEADIARWRGHAEHVLAREQGRARWYTQYTLQVARVERAYDWSAVQAPDKA
ncbi:MAG TPA: antibiotic biosynthesis monooxygenase [Burkholderiaceae bacterium]|nr:antibiotic biosynthesis monooxygenase [Burkholderiaceae bacterium]HMZ02248.1 antibiotic biosynthesis monooxygenase [Burkholderiaceae bacterium]HNB45704.1 antibiotic biosynthesis monooxygenase [Burkholderiaceae bacterium]HNG80284.1 antibiotic biosynthesis monooxygenase [Burkholderiaceae bacterium]